MGFVKRIRKVGSKLMFIVLSDYSGTVQLVVSNNLPKSLTQESSIEVLGQVVEGKYDLEIHVEQLNILSLASSELPFEVNCADIQANLAKILNYRAFSLRNEHIAAIFKVQSTITAGFSEYLISKGFTSIKSPKLVAGATETGASVFSMNYFGKTACLAQSPQFYKQMMVGSGLERVFEVGPVFRAESHNTSRHINEYTSLDLEIGFITSIKQLMSLEQELLNYIVNKLNKEREYELKLLSVYPLRLGEIPNLTLSEARKILKKEYNYEIMAIDIDPKGEKLICNYVKEKYNSNAIFLTEYPTEARPFYTMPHNANNTLTQSFDLIYNGVEITTGGLRIHNYEQLLKSATKAGLNATEIEHYLTMFNLGMPPHGGFAIGLERLTAQLLGIENIKQATLFPRDQQRLVP
ncbi:aspartate--tRNA(Asn) ligase [Clostridium sp. 'deep sea']|nr:aspartate--tRNA(Asn) ligase [Clostridium sp. 'deep sea']